MHLLSATPGGFIDDDTVITRLDQTPGEMIILSAADTTVAGLASAVERWHHSEPDAPEVRIANLLFLRQHASVDLYLDSTVESAKVVVIELLGGQSYWTYGVDRLRQWAERTGSHLVFFPGDDAADPELMQMSTLPVDQVTQLWQYVRQGGASNLSGFLKFLACVALGKGAEPPPPAPLASHTVFDPTTGQSLDPEILGTASAVIVCYMAHLKAANLDVFQRLVNELAKRGVQTVCVAVNSLKQAPCGAFLCQILSQVQARVLINTTAFSHGELSPGIPAQVFRVQAVLSGSNEEAWLEDTQGLSTRDLAMHVVTPEIDGRVLSRAISFKGMLRRSDVAQCDLVSYVPHDSRIEWLSGYVRCLLELSQTENPDKRIGFVLANYPTREGRLGNGVGLDTPASVVSMLRQLEQAGYCVDGIPEDGDALLQSLLSGVTNDLDQAPIRTARQSWSMHDYMEFFTRLPAENQTAVIERWGQPGDDPMLRNGRFMVSGVRLGNIFVGIQPSRGYNLDPMANYHDPDLVPPHYYLAFYGWMRHAFGVQAVVHFGKHGNLEWLPGKSVALSETCWPDVLLGDLPNIYPFIVNDPGEGTQAKRRSQAVIVDHLMPPLARAETYGPLRELERLVDEYYEALALDRQRAQLLRNDIIESICAHNLHQDLGLDGTDEDALLQATDAYLCELKESQIRNGLHIFGELPKGDVYLESLLSLARFPVGSGRDSDESLIRALAMDLLDQPGFDPLDCDFQAPWEGERPEALCQVSDAAWRSFGDTRERLESLAYRLLSDDLIPDSDWIRTGQVMARIRGALQPAFDRSGASETEGLLQALNAAFVEPGPSGAPSRGRPDTLPTGRNFFSVDTRMIPTYTAWTLGFKSANRVIEKHLQDEGEYPARLGLSVWGTATMRTGGDDIAQAFALMGVKPVWVSGSHRVTDFIILPLSLLDRPRVDVTLRVSGFFRDAFMNVIRLFDSAVQAVAALDEPDDMNPLAARVRQEANAMSPELDVNEAHRLASYRVFGSKPGAYGAGLQGLIDSGDWSSIDDLTEAYLNWGGFAYGQQAYGAPARAQFAQRLSEVQVVLQNQDNREHDVLDSDDYYQFQGGMAAATRSLSGSSPKVYFGDHSLISSPKIQSIEQELSRVIRSRVTNPKWTAAMRRHGYKGGFEMAATVDYLFAYSATTGAIRDDQYEKVAETLLSGQNLDFLNQFNPQALRDMAERFLEAHQRGLFNATPEREASLKDIVMSAEGRLEGTP